MAVKSGILGGVKWTSLGAFVNIFTKLGQIIVLTRYLSKEDFGLVAIALLYISFTEIFMDMGISSAVLHKKDISKNEYSSLYWFNIISGIFIFILLYLFAPIVANCYKQPELKAIISLLSLNIIFSSIARLQRTFQQKYMQFKVITLIEISASVLMLMVTVILAINNYRIYSLIYSTLFYGLSVALFYLSYSLIKEKNIIFHFKISEIKPYIKIGVFQVGSSTLDYLSREMDIFIIGSLYSLEILGAYSICKQLSLKIYSFINPIITKVLTPSLAYIQFDKPMLRSKYIQVIRLLAFIDIPIYFILCYSSTYVLSLIYGTSYIQYSILFSILCINYAFSSIGNPVGSLLIALGKTNIGFYWTIYSIISTAIFLYLGSMIGITYFVLSILLVNLVNIYPEVKLIYQRLLGVKYGEYIRCFSVPLFCSLILSPLFAVQYIISNMYIGLPIIIIIFTSFYLLLSLIYNKKDIKILNKYLKLERFTISRYILMKFQVL